MISVVLMVMVMIVMLMLLMMSMMSLQMLVGGGGHEDITRSFLLTESFDDPS